MSEVFAVVEGPTEQTFVREALAPWLGHHNVFLKASIVGKPGHKGGNKYDAAKRDITNFLKQRSDTIVTCMFDFYGMKTDWPGRESANAINHDGKPLAIESAIKADIASAFGESVNTARFIPYVQMHEFEALLFSNPPALAKALGNPQVAADFQIIRDEFETPEHINDGPDTAPAKRIGRVHCGYRKPLHGSIAAKEITIETMSKECPHFRSWIDKLVALG